VGRQESSAGRMPTKSASRRDGDRDAIDGVAHIVQLLAPCGRIRAGHACSTARQRAFLMAGARQYETDVAIVGAGAAGIAAGIEARDAGARAIAFERDAKPGGAAIISGGGCFIVGSPLQEQHGIHDTPDLAFSDWITWGGPSADEVWARYYIEHTLHDLYHW